MNIINKLLSGKSLSVGEADIFLTSFTNAVCKHLNINEYNNMECERASLEINRIFLLRYKQNVIRIDIKKELGIALTHFFNIISIKVDENYKSYLIDLNFSQFFTKKYINNNNKAVNFQQYLDKSDNIMFSSELKDKGFIELTESNLKKYIYMFLDSVIIIDDNSKDQIYNRIRNQITSEGFLVNGANKSVIK